MEGLIGIIPPGRSSWYTKEGPLVGIWEMDPDTLDCRFGRPCRRALDAIGALRDGLMFTLDRDDTDGKRRSSGARRGNRGCGWTREHLPIWHHENTTTQGAGSRGVEIVFRQFGGSQDPPGRLPETSTAERCAQQARGQHHHRPDQANAPWTRFPPAGTAAESARKRISDQSQQSHRPANHKQKATRLGNEHGKPLHLSSVVTEERVGKFRLSAGCARYFFRKARCGGGR